VAEGWMNRRPEWSKPRCVAYCALCTFHHIPQERTFSPYSTKGWVNIRAILNIVMKKKSHHYQESNPQMLLYSLEYLNCCDWLGGIHIFSLLFLFKK
jgi:hypothetical protein